MLVFSMGIKREAVVNQIPGRSIVSIETFLVLPSVIVDNGLTEVITVV